MRTRPALLAVLATVLGVVLVGLGMLVLRPSATGVGQVPAPISVPTPTDLPPASATEQAPTTAPSSPTDVVPPPPLDDDEDDDDGDTDDPDDVDDDGED